MADQNKKNNNSQENALLQLTGILGIYDNPVEGENITQIKIGTVFSDNENSVQFEIVCKEFKKYVISIDTEKKIVYNDLIISNADYKGACLACLNSQIYYASLQNYKLIELCAYYDDKPYDLRINGEIVERIPWTGYKVWGKYGFVMDEYDRINLFVKEMRSYGMPEDYIHQIYLGTPEANAAKEKWAELRKKWEGEFDLRDDSLSLQILEGLNERYPKLQ